MEYNTLNIEHSYTSDCDDAEYMVEDEDEDEVDESIGKSEDIRDIKNENDDSEDVEEYCDSNSNAKNPKNIRIWTNEECTKRILELYNDLNPRIGRSGHFTKKKQMYEYIAKKLYEEFGERFTGEQVASRTKNVLKGKTRYMKNVQVQNIPKMSGTENKSCEINIFNYNLESMYDDDNGEDFQTEYEDNESVTNPSKANFTNKQSRKLLRLYNMFMPNIGLNHQFKTKKDVWEAISEELFHEFGIKYSSLQCDSRYKTIKRKAKRLLLRGELRLNAKERSKEFPKDMNERNITYKTSSRKELYRTSNNESNPLCNDKSNFIKIEMDKDDDIYNSIHNELKYCQNNDRPSHTNSFDPKFQKFSDKELMKQYIEFKEKKEKMEQNRHKEIMEQLHKINQTLLEIKSQRNVYKKT